MSSEKIDKLPDVVLVDESGTISGEASLDGSSKMGLSKGKNGGIFGWGPFHCSRTSERRVVTMDALEAIKGRRSIRKYKPDPISDEMLGTFLEAVR